MLDEFNHSPRIAYFTMEMALSNEMPTYAGGLGILAGDTMRINPSVPFSLLLPWVFKNDDWLYAFITGADFCPVHTA